MREAWLDLDGPLPITEGTAVRLAVEGDGLSVAGHRGQRMRGGYVAPT
ncbi:hypothetical protein ACFWAP_11035 [Streptomyces goshikiensis]